jgi:heparan-alpha-glucosaminide N-acetyltransferase
MVGLALLVAVVLLYRTEGGAGLIQMRPHWWGILGLIGWAYLTVGLLVLVLGFRREWLMGALALLMTLHLALYGGGLFAHVGSKSWLGPAAELFAALARGIDAVARFVSLRDATGSLAAVTMAGCLLGTILRRDSDLPTHRARVGWALTFTAGLFLAGCLTDTFEGINKIAATPTWCLWSAALACAVWILLYLVLDVAGVRVWSMPLRAAGANPLVAYFLHPIVVQGIALAGFGGTMLAYKTSAEPWLVVVGSVGMATFVCLAAGLLGRLGLRVRL